jgi:transposase
VITGGHRNDGALLEAGPGRPRTRPDAVLADKAYAAGVYRRALHARAIKVVIPEKSDQIAARKRRGSAGGRPPSLDTVAYRGRNVVERHFALTKQWRGLATRYDKLAITYRAAVILAACLTSVSPRARVPAASYPARTAHPAPLGPTTSASSRRLRVARGSRGVEESVTVGVSRAHHSGSGPIAAIKPTKLEFNFV